MNSTLAALEAAINANPADRTVRLVFADSLDETGDPADADRAAFIRAQVEREAMSSRDPRWLEISSRCRDLFTEHWIDWWQPVCAVLGLPKPHVPGRGIGGRLKRLLTRDAREPGWPYLAHAHAASVESHDLTFTAQFIAGFPELLAIHEFTTGTHTSHFHAFFTRAAFHRLRLARSPSEAEWDSLDGPHLARLTELTVDQLTRDFAARLLQSPLRDLVVLRVGPLLRDTGVIRPLIHNPPWSGLRSLTLLGISQPAAIHSLASDCTLAGLEELTFEIGEVPTWLASPGIASTLGAILDSLHLTNPFGPPLRITTTDFWPALQSLAASQPFRLLRRLRIIESNANLIEHAVGMDLSPEGVEPEPGTSFPESLVTALADGLNADKLERLELPASRLSRASRAALAARFGSRFNAS